MKEVLDYFAHFHYAPTKQEIIKFYPKKVKYITLKRNKYEKETKKRNKISDEKEKKIALFIKIVGKIPWVKLLGYSGSVAMRNANETDDIDFFVITQANKLWSTRFILVLLTFFLGKKRWPGQKKAPNTICLNLFFDEQDVVVPKRKRSLYTAHEVLQVRPIINRDFSYERFLWENKWIVKHFPNNIFEKYTAANLKGYQSAIFENMAKRFQLFIMKKRTTETITDTQLWFIPQDVSKSFPLHDR